MLASCEMSCYADGMSLQYQILNFRQLGLDQLYDILALRSEVFVVEQQCYYQDPDGLDMFAHHLMALDGVRIVGCARILPPGKESDYASIGRYALAQSARGKGQGRAFFSYAVQQTQKLYPKQTLYIQAQQYLQRFYESFGFEMTGEPYEDAAVMHVDMLKRADEAF